MPLDATHDPALRSWVESANDPATDFPIQNLPLGVFAHDGDARHRIGVAIGESILDLDACAAAALLDELGVALVNACRPASLNALFARGRGDMRALRRVVSQLLRADGPEAERARALRSTILADAASCTMSLPATIGDYTDFYASVHHATNVGAMFRPDNPLLPNYKWVPIGYHGRASSIVPSGSAIRRPHGQTRADQQAPPVFQASRSLDYEVEVGAYIGTGNALGRPIRLAEADDAFAGLCLVNDWSARDIQAWEYQPLGPFLAKNFATSVSPWVVALDALEPFRVSRTPRDPADPTPLPYLDDTRDVVRGGFDITLEASLRSAKMRDAGVPAYRLSRGSFREMYWTMAQMLAHHTSNGCNMRPGDLIASGTVSGPTRESRGCLLELTSRGKEPLTLPTGETRAFLEDGDELVLRGWCERPGYRRIGFGECRGMITPAD